MSVKVDFNKALKELNKLNSTVQNKISEKALEAGCKVAVEEIKSGTPVDTGALRENIGVINKSTKSTFKTRRIGVTTKDKTIQARNFYTNYGNKYMNGTRWFKRSFNNSEKKIIKSMVEVIKENL